MDNEKTGAFDANQLGQARCPDCGGSGELRFESENINEHFEVEQQVVITPCARCHGTGFVAAGYNRGRLGTPQERERHPGYDTANYPGRNHGLVAAG